MGILLQHRLILCLVVLSFHIPSSLERQPPISCHEYEKLALLKFKQSFITDCPNDQHAASYPKMNQWGSYEVDENADCCTWDGVECEWETGHVVELDLSSSCLYGTFPQNSTLFSLAHLEKLNLAGNDFNFSPIPASVCRLRQLRHLNLSRAVFSGQIPSQFSELSKLTVLDLSLNGNGLGSTQLNLKLHNPDLHKLVQNLTQLNLLFLDGVDVSSNLPTSLTNLTSLEVLSLSYCNIYGELPASFFELPHLQVLVLGSNRKLTGHLPEFRPINHPLRRLDLSATGLSGVLPPSIGNLGLLDKLRLYSCQLSGKIPSSLGNLTQLTQLSLSANNFEGDLPSSVKNLTQLHMLGISSIQVQTRDLHSWLPKLSKLTALGFANISGLSSVNHHDLFSHANLTKLSYLDLSRNQLTGPVPHWLVNMTQLTWLYLGDNHLQGPLPQWLPELTNLRSLTLSQNKLSGNFETLFKIKSLHSLDMSGVNMHSITQIFSDSSFNSSHPINKLKILNLESCNLMELPRFLVNQDQLQFLSLSRNKIKGNLPKWFMNMSRDSLLLLDLSRNLLTSIEMNTLVLPWTRLKFLDISGNRLKGSLPCPPNLTEIYLVRGNQFTGVIPKQICSVRSLSFLDLSENNLSGRIPSCIAELLGSSLLVLNLRGNHFHGTMTGRFTSSCQLKMINFSENQLEGKLTRSLAKCKMLEVLDIGNNRVTDTFPYWLKSLTELQVLVLRHNYFQGQIPSPMSLHDFPSLHILDLSYNLHTGTLPFGYLRHGQETRSSDDYLWDSSSITISSEFNVLDMIFFQNQLYNYSITITNKGSERYYSRILNVFQVIDLSSNNFTGHIPNYIGDLTGLRALNLSNNNLNGGIPARIANIKVLESLDLSQNKLSGQIPQELVDLTSLEIFKVSYNQLTGPIPRGNQFDTFDTSSYVGNIGLCGNPLSKMCGKPHSVPPMPLEIDHVSEDQSTPLIDWIVRVSGCISGLIVGYVIGQNYIADRYHHWFVQTFGTRRQRTQLHRS